MARSRAADSADLADGGTFPLTFSRSTASAGASLTALWTHARSSPGGVWGGSYSYADADVMPGTTYYYKLEELEVGGAKSWYGPILTGGSDPSAVVFAGVKTRTWGSLALVLGMITLLAIFARARRRR